MGTKIGILGHNGAGKTSLIKLIMQELEPVSGKCLLPNAVDVGFFAQHHVDILNLNETPLQYLKKCFPEATLQGTFAKRSLRHQPGEGHEEDWPAVRRGEVEGCLCHPYLGESARPHYGRADEPLGLGHH